MSKEYKTRTIICIGCNKTVTRPARPNQKFCSLECYQKSDRPKRKTGKTVNCAQCKTLVYKKKGELKENNFCTSVCANRFQGREKIVFTCRTCQNPFKWSKSRITQANPTYCSMNCRNNDRQRMTENGILGNLAQLNKKGLNRLELKGNDILNDIGINYQTQVLMFDKFVVDVLIQEHRLIIQWDGVYWHTKPKRKALDQSQDAYFEKCGYRVLRITDRQIKEDINSVYEQIKKAAQ